jgi:hypothetical protein
MTDNMTMAKHEITMPRWVELGRVPAGLRVESLHTRPCLHNPDDWLHIGGLVKEGPKEMLFDGVVCCKGS